MLTCIDVKVIFDSVRLGFSVSPAPQIFSKQQMSPSELSSCCLCYVFSHYFA